MHMLYYRPGGNSRKLSIIVISYVISPYGHHRPSDEMEALFCNFRTRYLLSARWLFIARFRQRRNFGFSDLSRRLQHFVQRCTDTRVSYFCPSKEQQFYKRFTSTRHRPGPTIKTKYSNKVGSDTRPTSVPGQPSSFLYQKHGSAPPVVGTAVTAVHPYPAAIRNRGRSVHH